MELNINRDMAIQFVKENGVNKMLEVLESNYNLGLYRIQSRWIKDPSITVCKLKGTKENLLLQLR